jgi:hypothetical protein
VTNLGYNVTVILFWMATMTWLIWTKVLPPLLVGTPPTYARILDRQAEKHVGWDIYWDDEPVGTATTEIQSLAEGTIELHSRVDFHNLAPAKLIPLRIKALSDLVEQSHPRVSMWAESTVEVDTLGRLLTFESLLGSDLLTQPIRLMGAPEGNRLKLTLLSSGLSYTTSIYFSPDRPVGDTLSPQSRLPGLRIGQSWTEPVYNPFQPPNQPLELLHATVEREDLLLWNGTIERPLLVVYRTEVGTRSDGRREEARAQLWVRRDGTVLQQEARLGGSVVRFVRQPRQAVANVAASAEGAPPR